MVRAILVGLLTISAAAGCKGSSDGAPAVEPGKTVGKVVEAKGMVSATRSGTTRTLAAGAEISGDDVIETGADGRVTILLAHNNATWDLGPGKKEQVSTSMAWKLAKAEGPAGSVDETTTAAGRHAERHAATGGESAGAPAETQRQREVAPADTEAAPAAAAAPTATVAAPTAPTTPPAVTSPAPGGAPPPPTMQPTPDVAAPPPPPPPPPSDPRRAPEKAAATSKGAPTKTARNGDEIDALLGEGGGGGSKQKVAAPSGGGGGASDGEVDSLQVKTALQAQMPALRACVTASGKDKLTIKLKVTAGKTTITLPDGTEADRACFAKVATKIKLSGTTGSDIAVSIPKG